MNNGHGFSSNETCEKEDAEKRCVLLMTSDRSGVSATWSRHQVISGAAGVPERRN
jgi:hypothetical protein